MKDSQSILADKFLIGLVGQKGSGKETVARFLGEIAKEKVALFRSSDLLAETLRAWNLPLSRSNLQYMAIIMNDHFGDGTLSRAVAHRIARDKSDIAIFDGVRWLSDEKLVRSAGKNLIIYVTAPAELRFERSKKRGEKAGEARATFAQFMREEKEKTEIFIEEIGERAEVRINNDGTLGDLKKEVSKIYQKHILALLGSKHKK